MRFIGARALVNCLEDKVGGKYKRETRTAGVEFFFELIAANTPQARCQTGSVGLGVHMLGNMKRKS